MCNLKQETGEYGRSKRRPRLLGRGTIFLIVGILLIGGWRKLHPPKVMIERQVETSEEIGFKRKPAVSDLLYWSQDLNLRATQEDSLRNLLKKEQVKLKPVEEKIGQVTQEFNQFAAKHAAEPGGLKELQSAAQPISELSLKKRQTEQSFAERGFGILDVTQKEKARQLWEAKRSRMRDHKKEVPNL